jgi:hypothetical protein
MHHRYLSASDTAKLASKYLTLPPYASNATHPLSPNMLENYQSYGRCSIVSVEKECCTGILLW